MIKVCHVASRFNLLIKKTTLPKISRTHQTITIDMVAQHQPQSSRRPTCPTCSRPARTCLCTRLQAPRLNNSVKVTVLQHSLEQKHPLNSTRIATLGLENVEVFTVYDVNFAAHFLMRMLESGLEATCGRAGFGDEGNVFDEMSERGDKGEEVYVYDDNQARHSFLSLETSRKHLGESASDDKGPMIISRTNKITYDFDFIIGKYGTITSFSMMPNEPTNTSFEQILTSFFAAKLLTNGFAVKKKIQTNTKSEEYEIKIPPKSVLLFPSEDSVPFEDIDFEVRNLIVLDGTWAKAKRMYSENPWLRFLPHVKLDVQKSSLFGEVRHQPKTGYLSTIESIVYALKAAGEDSEGLDSLLQVFESMVGAQRECKNERLGFTGN